MTPIENFWPRILGGIMWLFWVLASVTLVIMQVFTVLLFFLVIFGLIFNMRFQI